MCFSPFIPLLIPLTCAFLILLGKVYKSFSSGGENLEHKLFTGSNESKVSSAKCRCFTDEITDLLSSLLLNGEILFVDMMAALDMDDDGFNIDAIGI